MFGLFKKKLPPPLIEKFEAPVYFPLPAPDILPTGYIAPPDGTELPLLIGEHEDGTPIVGDLTDMPHLLVAGTTGSGKSVLIQSLLTYLLHHKTPDEMKLVLIDPKWVEFAFYRDIKHLMFPVITDMDHAPKALESVRQTMERRFQKLLAAGVRNIRDYNKLTDQKLPYIVVVIDEFSDFMMGQDGRTTEKTIVRIAQKSRAVGIHLILATQRPSREVVTGLIKSNIPSRIAMKVTSKANSRIILDQSGAEELRGKGDLLFLTPFSETLIRAQGYFLKDEDIKKITEFWK